MIQVNRIYLIFNRLVTKKFLVDTSVIPYELIGLEKWSSENAHKLSFPYMAPPDDK